MITNAIGLLRVELDDELFLNGNVDLGALGQLVHENTEVRRNNLQPARNGTVAKVIHGILERQHLQRLGAHVDDVVLGHTVARDGHLLVVDQEVSVANQLAGLAAGAGQTGAVHNVVEARLKNLQEVLTCLAGTTVSFFVVATELTLENAVGVAGLLLFLELNEVFRFLDAVAAVLTRGVRAALECYVSTDKVNLEAAGLLSDRSSVCLLYTSPSPRD